MRADRGTANGDREKYYAYPKYSASYRFVEPLSRLTSIVDEFKLRASYGRSGNRPNYGVRDVTISSGGIIGGLGSLVAATTLGNPSIRPEVMNEQEYGLDAAMFKGRVGLEASIYRRRISDLLVTFPLPQSSGLLQQTINGGTMSTRGFEGGLNLVPISTKNLEWTFRTTYQHNTQKVDELLVPAFAVASSFGSAYGPQSHPGRHRADGHLGQHSVQLHQHHGCCRCRQQQDGRRQPAVPSHLPGAIPRSQEARCVTPSSPTRIRPARRRSSTRFATSRLRSPRCSIGAWAGPRRP